MTISKQWQEASPERKLEMLELLTANDQSVSCRLLGCDVGELDSFAPYGYSKVWVTVVDAAGMRDYDEGLVRQGRRQNDFGLRPRK